MTQQENSGHVHTYGIAPGVCLDCGQECEHENYDTDRADAGGLVRWCLDCGADLTDDAYREAEDREEDAQVARMEAYGYDVSRY